MSRLDGFRHLSGYLGLARQGELLGHLRSVLAEAPLYAPTMPRTGKPFSVRMTNCGPLGWVSDKTARLSLPGRAPPDRPALAPRCRSCCWSFGGRWPTIPFRQRLASSTTMRPAPRWARTATRTKRTSGHPSCRSRWGTMPHSTSAACSARGPKRRLILRSGDVVVLAGAARMAYHGVDRIHPGTSTLLPEGGRLNLTLRRVTASRH